MAKLDAAVHFDNPPGRRPRDGPASNRSLMPSGLLMDLKPADVADL